MVFVLVFGLVLIALANPNSFDIESFAIIVKNNNRLRNKPWRNANEMRVLHDVIICTGDKKMDDSSLNRPCSADLDTDRLVRFGNAIDGQSIGGCSQIN